MSALPYSQFLSHFKYLAEIARHSGLLLAVWTYSSRKCICIVAEYTNLDKKSRDELFQSFLDTYMPTYSLRLLHYTGKKTDSERNLVLIFEHCQSLSDFMVDRSSGNIKTLTIKEVTYIFGRLVQALRRIHCKGHFHGDIRESTLYVDSEGQVRILRLPLLPSNLQLAREMRSRGEHHAADTVLLPPDLEQQANDDSDIQAVAAQQMQQNDIFCLGLLSARLLNPALFMQALMEGGKQIDLEALSSLIESLAPHLGSALSSALRRSLAMKPEERSLDDQGDLNAEDESALSLLEWNEAVLKAEKDEGAVLVDNKRKKHLSEQDEIDRKGSEEKRDMKLSGDAWNDEGKKQSLADIKKETEIKGPIKSPTSIECLERGSENQYQRGRKSPLIARGSKKMEGLASVPLGQQLLRSTIRHTGLVDSSRVHRLRLRCIGKLEQDIFGHLSSKATLNKTLGETYFNLKVLLPVSIDHKAKRRTKQARFGSDRAVGFIQYPNGDMYFGFVRELCREDLGIHFFSNGEVLIGEFRRNRVSGQGTHLFLNGDVLWGHYTNDALHGEARLLISLDEKVLDCKFEEGMMVDRVEADLEVSDEGLIEFYEIGYQNSPILKVLKEQYIEGRVNFEKNSNCEVSSFFEESQRHAGAESRNSGKQELDGYLGVTKEELGAFNRKENKLREFYNGYYADLILSSQYKQDKLQRTSQCSNEESNKKHTPIAVSRFSLRPSDRQTRLAGVEGSGLKKAAGLNFKALGTSSKEYEAVNIGDYSSKFCLLIKGSHNAFYAEHAPSRDEAWQPVSQGTKKTPSKSSAVKHVRIIEEREEASVDASSQVLLIQIDQVRNRLQNVLDKIESEDEQILIDEKKRSSSDKYKQPGRKTEGDIEVLKTRIIRAESQSQSIHGSRAQADRDQRHEDNCIYESGFQQLCFENGDRFYGQFEAGRAQGSGMYYSRAGWTVQGSWLRGRLHSVHE